MSTVAKPSEPALIPQRAVYRAQNTIPPPKEDEDLRLRRFMFAPFLDVKLSRRHEVPYTGISLFHVGVIESINEHGFPKRVHQRNIQANFPGQYKATGRRLPGVIANRLAEKYGPEDAGFSVLVEIHCLKGADEDEVDHFQNLIFPVVPRGHAAAIVRLNHLVAINGRTLKEIGAAARSLVATYVENDSQRASVLADIKEAEKYVRDYGVEDRLQATIAELETATRTGITRGEYYASAVEGEMDSRSQVNGTGKPRADETDKKVFAALGKPVPMVRTNLQDNTVPALAPTAPTGATKDCIMCYMKIDVRARKCGHCGEYQDEETAAAAAVAPQQQGPPPEPRPVLEPVREVEIPRASADDDETPADEDVDLGQPAVAARAVADVSPSFDSLLVDAENLAKRTPQRKR